MTVSRPDTILVVDDTPANLAVVVERLEEQGFRAVVAEDGEEALQRAARVRPDLILLDVMMPGIDGFETCRRLKAADATHDIPVIFMSALGDTNTKIKGFEVGAVDYVTKPVESTEILARIRTHLTLRQMQRQLEALSITDPLTGLANRRRFDEVLQLEWRRALRQRTSLGAVMIDIDRFKLYNDHYGHVSGDLCLRSVAAALLSVARRDIDLAARFGGEEFTLILPGADGAVAAEVAARAHAAVLALGLPHAAAKAGIVTISAGAVAVVPAEAEGAGRLIELADAALYRAKLQGRNRVAAGAAEPGDPANEPASPIFPAESGERQSTTRRLLDVMIDSRQRWREFVTMTADFAFETDQRGRFTFIMPDPALGWPCTSLLEQQASSLLAAEPCEGGFNPLLIGTTMRRRTALKRADGSTAFLDLAVAPLRNAEGRAIGMRGAGIECTDRDDFSADVMAELRRGQIVEHILQLVGHEPTASLRLQAALESLAHALGAEGAVVVALPPAAAPPIILSRVGDPNLDTAALAVTLRADGARTGEADIAGGVSVLFDHCRDACAGSSLGVAFWRSGARRRWDDEDRRLLAAGAAIIQALAEATVANAACGSAASAVGVLT